MSTQNPINPSDLESRHGSARSCCYRETRFGPVALLWSVDRGRPRIRRVLLSRKGVSAERIVMESFPELITSSCSEIDTVAERIAAFLSGDDIRFSLDITRLDLCSRFQQKVLRAEHGIPRGCVSTYGSIAKHIGNGLAARATGSALATNPFPLLIPCHRAIRSDGSPGGYQGGTGMKRSLLEMEGILFDTTDRVSEERFFISDW